MLRFKKQAFIRLVSFDGSVATKAWYLLGDKRWINAIKGDQ